MYETPQDIRDLQRLLDESYARAGQYLRSMFAAERRLTAREVCDLLDGIQLIHLATVSASCRPLVAPVDGVFFHGRFVFGSSVEAVRFKHLRHRPQVSASHTRGHDLAVIVHGTAHLIDLFAPEFAELRDFNTKLHGLGWEEQFSGAVCAQIEPTRMFAVRVSG